MPRRMDIELTSSRDDGTWTWRAAGARAPKGTVAATVLPAEAKVGDVLKVEAEMFVDGIEITAVIPPKRANRKEPERLELLGGGRDEPLVTTTLAPKRERRGGGRRRDGEGRDAAGRGRRDGDRREERGRREGGDRPQRRRPEPPPVPAIERPKAKRLKAGKAHWSALLESLPEAERPIAEQLRLGGLPGVRQAIEKQNQERAAAGESPINGAPLIEIAERLASKVRAAEWRDRAEAAKKDIEVVDLRDLRSVVSAAGDAGKDPEARALADELKAALATRVEAEHQLWLQELTATLDVGRIVRALRVSSRPPKAGVPLPAELAARLVEGTNEALTAEASPERWVAVLDALAFSPVRDRVIPASLPVELHPDVRATIARLATRIPKIAHIFEIEPDRSAPRPKIERRRPRKPRKGDQPAGAPASRDARDEAGEKAAEAPTETPAAEAAAAPVEAVEAGPEAAEAEAPVEATAPEGEPEVAEATAPEPAPADEPEAVATEPAAADAPAEDAPSPDAAADDSAAEA